MVQYVSPEFNTDRQQFIRKIVVRMMQGGVVPARPQADQGAGSRHGEMTEVLRPGEGRGRSRNLQASVQRRGLHRSDDLRVVAGHREILRPRQVAVQTVGRSHAARQIDAATGKALHAFIRKGPERGHDLTRSRARAESRPADSDTNDGHLGRFEQTGLELGQGRKSLDEGRCRRSRAAAGLRFRGVARNPCQRNGQPPGGRRKHAVPQHDRSQRKSRQIVQPQTDVRLQLRIGRILENGSGARTGFFGRLKQEHRSSALRAVLRQRLGHTQHHRHVTVMTALVRNAVRFAGIGQISPFRERQGIGVTTQQDGGATPLAVKCRGQPVAPEIRNQRVRSAACEAVGKKFSCPDFGPRHLRPTMQFVSDFRQISLQHISSSGVNYLSDPLLTIMVKTDYGKPGPEIERNILSPDHEKNRDLEFSKIVLNQDFPTWADRDTLIRFFHETMQPYHDSREDVAKALDYALVPEKGQGGFVMLSHQGETLLGALCMLKTGMGGYVPENLLLFVTVAPEHRGRGVGKRLIEHCLAETDGDVKLHVEFDNPAKRLYERLGFATKYAEMRWSPGAGE
jgi:GNAT superfamily N-acetyltransferase